MCLCQLLYEHTKRQEFIILETLWAKKRRRCSKKKNRWWYMLFMHHVSRESVQYEIRKIFSRRLLRGWRWFIQVVQTNFFEFSTSEVFHILLKVSKKRKIIYWIEKNFNSNVEPSCKKFSSSKALYSPSC